MNILKTLASMLAFSAATPALARAPRPVEIKYACAMGMVGGVLLVE